MKEDFHAFGDFLKEKRKKAGLGQKQMGVDSTTVMRLELGRHAPTYRSLKKIAEAFQMETWELLKEFETGETQ